VFIFSLKLETKLEEDLEALHEKRKPKRSLSPLASVDDRLREESLQLPVFTRRDTSKSLIVPSHFKLDRQLRFKGNNLKKYFINQILINCFSQIRISSLGTWMRTLKNKASTL
jgi:hypothetical protein